MSYLLIIGIGYLFNFFCVIMYTVMLKVHKININYMRSEVIALVEQQQKVIDNNINPFRAKDFVILLPYGYGLRICTRLFVSKEKFVSNIAQEINEKYEYLLKLEKGIK